MTRLSTVAAHCASVLRPCKEGSPFSNSRFDALASCILEGLGVRYAVVGDGQWNVGLRGVERCERMGFEARHCTWPRPVARSSIIPNWKAAL